MMRLGDSLLSNNSQKQLQTNIDYRLATHVATVAGF